MINLLNDLIEIAVSKKATDLHLKTGEHPWIRVNTIMISLNDLNIITNEEIEGIKDSILTDKNKLEQFHSLGSTDFGYSNNFGHFRINLYRQSSCLALAIRVLPNFIPKLDTLNLPECLINLVNQRTGLILVTGATSNGKSTTLASLINEINLSKKKHIITIEDPIEYRYPKGLSLISQREIDSDCKDFFSAFTASLRQDPDVILIGELRDKETIRTAITAAETGHLVLSTLHTSSAAETIERILSYFDGNEQQTIANKLASSLKAVISQVLLPKKDNSGLICAAELLLPIISIKSLIRDNKCFQITSFMRINKLNGIITLEDSLKKLVERNIIDYDVALQSANDQAYFDSLFNDNLYNKKKR